MTLNRKCPLCKQDFRGKEYDVDSGDEEEEQDEIRGESSRRARNDIELNQLNNNSNNNAL